MNEDGRIANEVSDFGRAEREDGREDIAEGRDVRDFREREGRDNGDDDGDGVDDAVVDDGALVDGDEGDDEVEGEGRGVKRGDLSE